MMGGDTSIETPDFSHGIMFHHFHGGRHPVTQGSISAEEFSDMLNHLSRRHTILPAADYQRRWLDGTLHARDTCLTFDDALLCQMEVAVPVLRSRDLSAFFFIYSSPLCGEPDWLEVFRYFRTTQFHDIDAFYAVFDAHIAQSHPEAHALAARNFDAAPTIALFPHYSESDVWFRTLRDKVLGKTLYEEAMHTLMRESGFDAHAIMPLLWMNNAHLKALAADGHVIGLHSYSHPTMIDQLPRTAQENEYVKNMAHLTRVLGAHPTSMSHPCGRYNGETLALLSDMGVHFGFRSNLSTTHGGTSLEVPRRDHAAVLKALRAA